MLLHSDANKPAYHTITYIYCMSYFSKEFRNDVKCNCGGNIYVRIKKIVISLKIAQRYTVLHLTETN